ncbi:CsbD family protein [Aporhodopirellula aestuarii]|uniref:CsbD family protein n=1 Tax=Aporhodopirellula aestuarii TaxID=2950107 RepID=A0ABT0U475_9BACT|nr:CsbD family protein [Aporhodopirellula aestuarii]MCM2371657.1 CsbD family protein [Aporhodopirellula aestuarii]
MPNREELKGHWNEVKGRLKEHWGQLTDDDLRRAEGNTEQLVGVVQEKTGATRREVENFIDGLFNGSMGDQASAAVQQYAEAAQNLADDASRYARAQADRLAACSSDYSARVAQTVRSRPIESMAIVFGIGVAAGAFLFLGRKK